MPDTDAPVFGQSMSQISRHVDNMAKAAGLGDGYSSYCAWLSGDPAGGSAAGGADARALESPQMPAWYTELEALEWLVM